MITNNRAPLALALLAMTGSLALAACNAPQDKAPAQTPAEPVATETATMAATPISGEWASLEPLIGQYPNQSGLFENSAIVAPLKTLLGDKYDIFKTNMSVQGPLNREGDILYVSGNKPHEGGSNAAYLLVDPATKALEVGLWENGTLTTYPAGGTKMPKPKDIQTFISNSAS